MSLLIIIIIYFVRVLDVFTDLMIPQESLLFSFFMVRFAYDDLHAMSVRVTISDHI